MSFIHSPAGVCSKIADKHVLTNFSVNFPRDAVESLLTFIFVETCINALNSENFSLLVDKCRLNLFISILGTLYVCLLILCLFCPHQIGFFFQQFPTNILLVVF